MTMYIEFVFILNYLLDFMILYGTKRLLNRKTSIIRLVIGSLIASSTIVILFIDITEGELIIVKLLLSIIIIIITFGKNNILINIFYFYLISIIVGGVIYLFDILENPYIYYLLLIILVFITIKLFIYEFRKYHINIKNTYVVTIIIKKKKYILEGFIDTGNRLISPYSMKSIILVNLNINYNNYIYIPYKALNSEGVIQCIKPDKIIIDNKEINNCLIGLSKDKFSINNYNCILPNKLREELCLN